MKMHYFCNARSSIDFVAVVAAAAVGGRNCELDKD